MLSKSEVLLSAAFRENVAFEENFQILNQPIDLIYPTRYPLQSVFLPPLSD